MSNRSFLSFSNPVKFTPNPIKAKQLKQSVLEIHSNQDIFNSSSSLSSKSKDEPNLEKSESFYNRRLSNKHTFKNDSKSSSRAKCGSTQHAVPKGITDVDKCYFEIVKKRSTYKTKSFNSKQYINDIRNCFRQNLTTGFIQDQISKADLEFHLEQQKLKRIRTEFTDIMNHFENSLDNDHKKSMELLATASNEEALTAKRRMELESKQKEVVLLRSQLSRLHNFYDKCLASMAFVMRLSSDESYISDTDSGSGTNVSQISNELQINRSIDDLITGIQFKKQIQPKLTFSSPTQIFQLIADLEIQNQKLMSHNTTFKTQIQQQSYAIYVYEKCLDKEIEFVASTIKDVEKTISEFEQNSEHLKDHIDKLLEDFKSIKFDHANFFVRSQLEEIVSHTLNQPVMNERSKDLFNEIMREYTFLMFRVEEVPQGLFRKAFLKVKENQEKTLTTAHSARKRLSSVQLIQEDLQRLHNPTMPVRRKLVFRSKIPIKRKKEARKSPFEKLNETSSEVFRRLFVKDYNIQSKLLATINHK